MSKHEEKEADAVEVQCIPIAKRHNGYLRDVAARLRARGLRVEVDESGDRMQQKIRNARAPLMVIAGDAEVEHGTVSVRHPDGRQDNGVPVEQVVPETA